MARQGSTETDADAGETQAAIDAIRDAYDAAMAAIRAIAALDVGQGFRASGRLAGLLQDLIVELGKLRGLLAAQIYDETSDSLGDLAQQYGMSKARYAELVKAGRIPATQKTAEQTM